MTSDRRTMLILLGLDVTVAILVFNIIGNYRGIADHPIFGPLAVPVIVLVVAVFLIDGYNARTDMLSVDYFSLHTIAVLAAMVATLLLTFVIFPEGYELHSSRGVIALTFVALIPLTLGYRRMIHMQTASARSESSFVFVGDHAACQMFREECWKMGMQQPVIDSTIGEGGTPAAVAGKKVASPQQPLHAVLADTAAGRITVEAIVLRESSIELPPDIAQQLVHLFFRGCRPIPWSFSIKSIGIKSR